MHQRTHVPLTSRLHPDKTKLLDKRRNNINNRNDDNSKNKQGSFPRSTIAMTLTAVFLIACGEYTFFHNTPTTNNQASTHENSNLQYNKNTANNVRKTMGSGGKVVKDSVLSDMDVAVLQGLKDDDTSNANVGEEEEEVEEEPDDDIYNDYFETTKTKTPLYHIVFSTDCSDYQHWQSYLFFYSAYKVKQTGYITRIASGCTDSEQASEQAWHDKHILSMNSNFKIHYTPKFSTVKSDNNNGNTNNQEKDFKYFNKPFGLRHWMEHGDDMGLLGDDDDVTANTKLKNEDDIIFLLDPDMFFLRPLTHDFTHTDQLSIRRTIHPIDSDKTKKEEHWVVQHGKPFAQLYGYGAQWQSKINLEEVTGDSNTNAQKVNENDARYFYPVGPPYIATAKDMYNIAIKWTEFAPGVHKQYPYLLAEMFAYSIAAAHLNLPHQPIESLMLSYTGISIEGWDWIDAIPLENICTYNDASTPTYNLPYVFHYCQRYMIKDYLFAKRKKQVHNFFTCESPLFKEIDFDDVKNLDYKMMKDSTGVVQEKLSKNNPKIPKREIFSLCTILPLMNEAAKFLKTNHCIDDADVKFVNWDKTLNLWD